MSVPRGAPATVTLLLLVSLLLPALPPTASRTRAVAAAPVERMAITATMVNLRQHPTPLARIDRILRESEEVAILGDVQYGYYPVRHEGWQGWLAADLVEYGGDRDPLAQQNPLNAGPAEAIAVETLNLREGPGTEFPVLREIPMGTTLTALPENHGDYQKVQLDDDVGWVRSIYLDMGVSFAPASDLFAQATIEIAGGTGGGQAILAAEVNLREDPNADAKKLDVVPLGSVVELTGRRRNGYAEVRFKGRKGWLAEDYLNLQDDAGGSGPEQIPVLMYHSVQENTGAYQVTAEQLDEQLAWLASNGYTSITSREFLAWIIYRVPLPAKPILIAIDDGNATDWFFLEALERHGMKGVFFVPDFAGLTAAQIRTLDRAGEVCGHTVSHPLLSTLSYDGQYAAILNNKTYLEEILGRPITCFAYPFGDYNTVTGYAVVDAGYLIAYNAWGGPAPLTNDLDRWHITRINVNGNASLSDFIQSLEG